jgi:hypothetical protein
MEAKPLLLLERSFNPEQPRDHKGRWSDVSIRRMSRIETVKQLVDNQQRVAAIDRDYTSRLNAALGVKFSYSLSPGDIAQAYTRLDSGQRSVVDALQSEIAAKKKPFMPRQAWDESGPTLTGVHFSAHTLNETDPGLQGTGQPGQERRRFVNGRDVSGGMVPGFVPYTNFYIADQSSAIEDRFLGGIAHLSEPIEKKKLWDIRKGGKPYAELVKQGYEGVYYPNDNQLHMFVPVKVRSVGKIQHLPENTLITGDMIPGLTHSR